MGRKREAMKLLKVVKQKNGVVGADLIGEMLYATLNSNEILHAKRLFKKYRTDIDATDNESDRIYCYNAYLQALWKMVPENNQNPSDPSLAEVETWFQQMTNFDTITLRIMQDEYAKRGMLAKSLKICQEYQDQLRTHCEDLMDAL